MAIALTEELLGFGRDMGSPHSSCPSSPGENEGDSSGGRLVSRRLSLVLVKAAVLQELEPVANPAREGTRSKSLLNTSDANKPKPRPRSKSTLLPEHRARMSSIGVSFKSSFRRVRRASVASVSDNNDGKTAEGGLHGDGETGGNDDATTDHRHVTSDTEAWKVVNKIMLDKAVQSIPAYIERSSLIIALVPPCKHADREDEICDESSWRGRGWCRVEYLGATLVRSNVSVMVVQDATTTPAFVWPVDGLTHPPGHGTYTCCSREIENYCTPVPQPCMLLPFKSSALFLLHAMI